MNLSLFLPGLGQVYCGALRRGLLHFCALTALPVVAIPPIIPAAYSTWDARRIALASCEDYRLKDSYRDRQPKHNDFVAFLNPANRRETWVKRVIALPGDPLEIK